MRRLSPRTEPFFLSVAYLAPHSGGPRETDDPANQATPVPAPRHRNRFASEPMPQSPSFNEADVSDKPAVVRNRRLLPARRIAGITENYRQRLESLLAIDEGIAAIVGALQSAGELDNTLFLYTSTTASSTASTGSRGQGAGLRAVDPRAARDPRAGRAARRAHDAGVGQRRPCTDDRRRGERSSTQRRRARCCLAREPHAVRRPRHPARDAAVQRDPHAAVRLHRVRERRTGAVRPRRRSERAREPPRRLRRLRDPHGARAAARVAQALLGRFLPESAHVSRCASPAAVGRCVHVLGADTTRILRTDFRFGSRRDPTALGRSPRPSEAPAARCARPRTSPTAAPARSPPPPVAASRGARGNRMPRPWRPPRGRQGHAPVRRRRRARRRHLRGAPRRDRRPDRPERRREDHGLQRDHAALQPDSGEIAFDGESLLRTKPHRVIRRGIARTFQNLALFPTMSILENVRVGEHGAPAAATRSSCSTTSAWRTWRTVRPAACRSAR